MMHTRSGIERSVPGSLESMKWIPDGKDEKIEISEVAQMAESFDRGELIRRALEKQGMAYAPYSKFYVAAAVLTESGEIYTGVNVENASYPAGTCAERNAIETAVACGERKITAIAIAGGKNGTHRKYCVPCGVCRQVMREFCNPEEMRVLLAKTAEEYLEMTLEELLPMSFGPEELLGEQE